MRLWSDFYDLIMPDLPGCPFTVADNALRQSAILFCEMSLAWRETLPDVTVVAGTNTYAYTPPTNSVVHAITYAEFNDKEIAAHTGESGLRMWDWRNQSGTPEYVLGGATSLILVPNPDIPGTLKLIAALKPAPAAPGVDDDIFNEWRDAVISGALARLMASPKKPYTDANMASFHQMQFFTKTGAAGMRVARSYTRAAMQTTIMSRGRRGT